MSLWDYLTDFKEKTKDNFEKKNSIGIFLKNYNDVKEANTKEADKYFHAKANCESAQQGKILPSEIISLGREIFDTPKNLLQGYSLEESLNDSSADIEANNFGRQMGLEYPNIKCKYLINKYRPNGLNEKY